MQREEKGPRASEETTEVKKFYWTYYSLFHQFTLLGGMVIVQKFIS